MNKARIGGITHLTGRLREEVTHNLKRKTLISEGILGITPEIFPRPISRMLNSKETRSSIQT